LDKLNEAIERQEPRLFQAGRHILADLDDKAKHWNSAGTPASSAAALAAKGDVFKGKPPSALRGGNFWQRLPRAALAEA